MTLTFLDLKGKPKNSEGYRVSGTLWPHGEFSYGYAATPKDDRLDDRPVEFSHPDDDYNEAGLGTRSEPGPLDLRDVPNSHKPPKRRGLKGITGYGKKMIKSVGALLEREKPRGWRVTFATLTLPVLSTDNRRKIAEAWPELVRRNIQWVSRQLGRAGLPDVQCLVTEIQPKRLAETGDAYLHLHCLWINKRAKSGEWTIDPNDWRDWFTRQIELVTGVTPGHINCDVKQVKGDATRYLAKYMSKGGALLETARADLGDDSMPRTWWNMSAFTRRWVKSAVIKSQAAGEHLELAVNLAFNVGVDEVLAYLRHVEIEFDGAWLTVGWYGRLLDEYSRTIRARLSGSRELPPCPV